MQDSFFVVWNLGDKRPTNNKNKLLAARIPIENNPDRNSVAGETKFWYTVYK